MVASSQSVPIEGTWEEILGRADQFAGKRVRITVLPEVEQDATARGIREHDIVSVLHDLETEGYSLREGMIGAVVSVYRNGEAFAVEFPDLDGGSAVVTLRREQIQRAGASA